MVTSPSGERRAIETKPYATHRTYYLNVNSGFIDALGDHCVEAGNTEEARKAFEKVLEIDPLFDASKPNPDERDHSPPATTKRRVEVAIAGLLRVKK